MELTPGSCCDVMMSTLSRHLQNDSDPLVQLLDPFQLLPASEDIHEKGVFK